MPHLSAEERAQVLEWLDESHRQFLDAIGGTSDTQWQWKPAAGQWSAGETAEHVVLTEAVLFGQVRKALAAPANPVWEEQTKGKTDFLVRLLPSRVGKAVAPAPIVPRHGLTRMQVQERFEQQRLEIVSFAAEVDLPLKQHTLAHPFPIFGTLNAYQWLIYAPLHTIRHVAQIGAVKAMPGYPAA
jgi:DinB family protein